MTAKVGNAYKEALEAERSGAAGQAHELETALDGAWNAMAAGAWQSSAATEFEHALRAQRSALRTAGESVLREFDAKIRAEPDLVDAHSWQALFYRMNRYVH